MNTTIIDENSEILLIRFKSALDSNFIADNYKAIKKYGYVWIPKAGKITSEAKLYCILKNGGWLLLKSKKEDGGKYYFAKFDKYCRGLPEETEKIVPEYKEMYEKRAADRIQSFRIVWISEELSSEEIQHIKLKLDDRVICEMIDHTSTAVMFVYNDCEISMKKYKGD